MPLKKQAMFALERLLLSLRPLCFRKWELFPMNDDKPENEIARGAAKIQLGMGQLFAVCVVLMLIAGLVGGIYGITTQRANPGWEILGFIIYSVWTLIYAVPAGICLFLVCVLIWWALDYTRSFQRDWKDREK